MFINCCCCCCCCLCPCAYVQTVVGSSRLFSALLVRCLARELVAICQFTPTANAAPRIVALMPQVNMHTCTYTHISIHMHMRTKHKLNSVGLQCKYKAYICSTRAHIYYKCSLCLGVVTDVCMHCTWFSCR